MGRIVARGREPGGRAVGPAGLGPANRVWGRFLVAPELRRAPPLVATCTLEHRMFARALRGTSSTPAWSSVCQPLAFHRRSTSR